MNFQESTKILNACTKKKKCGNLLKAPRIYLAYTPAPAETLLQSLERAAGCIGLHVNAENQRGDISTLNGSSLKLVDKFTYIESSVS